VKRLFAVLVGASLEHLGRARDAAGACEAALALRDEEALSRASGCKTCPARSGRSSAPPSTPT
jgi:hypothetical protein